MSRMEPMTPDAFTADAEPAAAAAAAGDACTAIATIEPAALGELQRLADAANRYKEEATSKATRRAYAADWRDFTAWCASVGATPLPADPETLIAYITALADTCRPSTIDRRLAGIRAMHRDEGLEAPTFLPDVSKVRQGIRRELGVDPNAKAAAGTEEVLKMVATLPTSLRGLRDRALLLVGFAAALRRSELVGVDVEHLTFSEDGVRILVPKSKTDQAGEGAAVGVLATNRPTCPVAALRTWIDAAGVERGAVFLSFDRRGRMTSERLSGYGVAIVVKRAARAAGLDPERFAGHSLRAGMVTEAFANGVAAEDIMRTTRHKRHETLMRYRREARLFHNNASGKLGL